MENYKALTYSRVSNNRKCSFYQYFFNQFSTKSGQIKMSHSIHMLSIQLVTKSFELSKSKCIHSIHILSIQIDTKSLKLVIYHQFNNIKLSFFTSHVKSSFYYVRLMDAVRLLDALKYTSYCLSKTNEGLLSQFYPT